MNRNNTKSRGRGLLALGRCTSAQHRHGEDDTCSAPKLVEPQQPPLRRPDLSELRAGLVVQIAADKADGQNGLLAGLAQ